jgi:hypothetical protein
MTAPSSVCIFIEEIDVSQDIRYYALTLFCADCILKQMILLRFSKSPK